MKHIEKQLLSYKMRLKSSLRLRTEWETFVVFQEFKNTTKHYHNYKMYIVCNFCLFLQDLILFYGGVKIFTLSSIAFTQWPNKCAVWQAVCAVFVKTIFQRFNNKCLYIQAELFIVIHSVYQNRVTGSSSTHWLLCSLHLPGSACIPWQAEEILNGRPGKSI
jgi:hypothetical protein